MDRVDISPKAAFKRAKKLEANYAARLRKIARHVGEIVSGFDWSDLAANLLAQTALKKYADLLKPWAESVANRMVTEVAASDRQSWRKLSARIGQTLAKEIDTAPTGQVMRESMRRQVDLITSLPTEAAERVHKLTQEGITQGRRASEIADEILKTGEVTRSRATLIAVTEVSRTGAELTRARALHIGSPGYRWRTAKDTTVRPSHRQMEGKFVGWNDPPTLDNLTGHAGCLPRCRCYMEVEVPE